MFKKMHLIIATVLLSSIVLVGCGITNPLGGSSDNATSKSSTSVNQIDVSKINIKTIGAMVLKEVEIENKQETLPRNFYYYVDKNDKYAFDRFGKNTYGFTANGDGIADISYAVQGGLVKYSYLQTLPNKPDADAKAVIKQMSLQQLAQRFYNTKQQKTEIDEFVNSVIPNSYFQTSKDYPK